MAEEEWTINYLPEEGGRYTGKLALTAEMLSFASLYESSNKTVIKAIFADVTTFAAAGGHTVYRYSNDQEARVDLPLSDVTGVHAEKKGLMNRAVVTMENGESFVFDYGMLKVKKLVAAIEAQLGK